MNRLRRKGGLGRGSGGAILERDQEQGLGRGVGKETVD